MVKIIWIISAAALVVFFLAGGNKFVKPAFQEVKHLKDSLTNTVTDIKTKAKGDQVG